MPLVQQFEQLWGSNAVPPDVFAFLKQQQPVNPQQWLGILLADQQRRWATDNPWKVEDYLLTFRTPKFTFALTPAWVFERLGAL